MKKFVILTILFLFVLFTQNIFSQVSDIDGNTYKTVIIGKQEWMAENLNVEHYRNGDPIPQIQDKEEWANLTTGAWCYYENNSENGVIYGKLYNWYAVMDPRGLAPEGWHIPDDEEWNTIINLLGGAGTAGKEMKSSSGWIEGGNGTNSSGFSGLPGGYRNHDGYFSNIGKNGIFWSSTAFNEKSAWFRNLIGSISDVYRPNYFFVNGLSIRCVKD
jgi:uncharacterized protein (TIGR02145 family)